MQYREKTREIDTLLELQRPNGVMKCATDICEVDNRVSLCCLVRTVCVCVSILKEWTNSHQVHFFHNINEPSFILYAYDLCWQMLQRLCVYISRLRCLWWRSFLCLCLQATLA